MRTTTSLFFSACFIIVTLTTCSESKNPLSLEPMYVELDELLEKSKCLQALDKIEYMSEKDSLINIPHEKIKVVNCLISSNEKENLEVAVNLGSSILYDIIADSSIYTSNKFDGIELCQSLSSCYYQLGKPDSALVTANQGLDLIGDNQYDFFLEKKKFNTIIIKSKIHYKKLQNVIQDFKTHLFLDSLLTAKAEEAFRWNGIQEEKEYAEKKRNELYYILLTILLLSLILYLIQKRESKVKKRAEALGRQSLADDLHDELGIEILKVDMLLKNSLLENSDIASQIKETIEKFSFSISHYTRLTELDINLSQSIRDIIEVRINPSSTNYIEYQLLIEDEKKIPSRIRMNILRLIMELCNNVNKHASATQTYLIAKISKQKILLEIKDNGKGINPDIISDDQFLRTIKRRINRINTKTSIEKALTIKSKIGTGTQIIIDFPLPKVSKKSSNIVEGLLHF